MPLPTPTADFFWAVIHMNGNGGGWSEKYALKLDSATDRAAARSKAMELAARRATSLASGCSILWGRLSLNSNPKDATRIIFGKVLGGRQGDLIDVGGTPIGEFTNSVQTALHYRCETTDGKWSNRLLRGVPDELVIAGDAPLAATGNFAADALYKTWAAPANFKTYEAMGNFLTYIQRNTYIASPEFAPVRNVKKATGKFSLLPIDNISFRKVASHDTGRPFGFSPGRQKASI